MRTLKSIFAALFLLSFLSVSFANSNNTSISTHNEMFIEARVTTHHTVDLRLANVQAPKLTIRLKNEADEVLYFEKIKDQTAYFKHFILEELPDGNYYFAISQVNTKDVIKQFSIENGVVQVSSIKAVFAKNVPSNCAFKVICVDDLAANLHVVNNTNQKVMVRLKDADGQVWYFEKVAQKDTFQKRFNLSQLPDGKYMFSVDGTKDNSEQVLYIKNGVVQLEKSVPRA